MKHFKQLENKFGGSSGDVAQAYVIAHEVGHHVQNKLGQLKQTTSESSVTTELRADCFAGLWLGSLDTDVLEEGEIREALDAASAVGDDNIQKRTAGTISPESWTHGSSQERTEAFLTGYKGGGLQSCKI